MFKTALILTSTLGLVLGACNAPTSKTDTPVQMIEAKNVKIIKHDKFTYANYDQVRVTHLDLDLDVNFDKKILDGMATLDFKRVGVATNELVLDSRDLLIKAVSTADDHNEWTPAKYTLGESDVVLGSSLTIQIGNTANKVRISYSTSPDAEGLQWLSPAQTAGKKHPYLFSQAQALNARTMAPLQDTPAVRMTYTASLRVPDGLRPLMSAEQGDKDENGIYHFNMPQPIPSYLLAIAVGDIKFKAINDHIGVYAEQYILDAAAEEFSETPLMEASNAKLYGPYRWGRYDLIVLPPSFPFGGMENPRLSFMTPTLIAGDKSLTNVVAHELAHSWSGNLVTNSNWRDAWLNEGFTSYVENRVMEDLYGEGRAVMEQALSLEDLKRDIKGATRPELTQLKLPADLAHPDEAFSQVAYVKGQFFLMFLEERFGRENFDAFLKGYFDHFAFQSITTEDFIKYLHDELHVKQPDALTKAELKEWIYEAGLPDTAKNPKSDAFENVAAQQAAWLAGTITAAEIKTTKWSTHEWLYFLNSLPEGLAQKQFNELDTAYSLTGTQNAETAFAWYMQAIKGDYHAVDKDLEHFFMTVGRGKFIYRLYGELAKTPTGKTRAVEIFARARAGYHPIAQRRIGDILSQE
ncbi:MAG: M1 family metallopeptidase [Robiginitomaculum sp.]|nr:M1 family metallopeptidase [Robiginitomaculum sp.]